MATRKELDQTLQELTSCKQHLSNVNNENNVIKAEQVQLKQQGL